MLRCLDNTIGLSRYAEPGAWNDPDMLEVTHVLCSVMLYNAPMLSPGRLKCSRHWLAPDSKVLEMLFVGMR